MKRRLGLVFFCILILLVIAFGVMLFSSHSHGLRAELKIETADIGIPGITKAYEAKLVNRSLWPIRVQYCDFMTDAMTRRKSVPYTLERWDANANEWKTMVRANGEEFCRPYPLGIVQAKLRSRLLWPGQSISTGEEATAARDGFSIGDKVRFLI